MEHLATIDLTAAGTARFAIPNGGSVVGVYSSSPVTLGYEDNGSIGTMKTNVTEWEPIGGFNPSPTAHLHITAAAAAKVVIRYVR